MRFAPCRVPSSVRCRTTTMIEAVELLYNKDNSSQKHQNDHRMCFVGVESVSTLTFPEHTRTIQLLASQTLCSCRCRFWRLWEVSPDQLAIGEHHQARLAISNFLFARKVKKSVALAEIGPNKGVELQPATTDGANITQILHANLFLVRCERGGVSLDFMGWKECVVLR